MNPHAYVYGWWAAAMGTPERWNPFRPDTAAFEGWREGHRDSVALERRVVPRMEPEIAQVMSGRI